MVIDINTAKLAKEKGFNNLTNEGILIQNGNLCPIDDKVEVIRLSSKYHKNYDGIEFILTPIQSELQDWLREEHRIDVIITFSEFSRTYGFKIYLIRDGKTMCFNNTFSKYETYPIGLEKALFDALNEINNEEIRD